MTQALFYLLPDNGPADEAMAARDRLACQLAEQHYRQGQWVYIHCRDEAQSFAIDELLWQFEPDAFVPHNLKGEGPQGGAPVEIGADRLGPGKHRGILINLAEKIPAFAVNFGHIIDFVAGDEATKALARARYKAYRDLGIALSTQDLATQPLNLV
ncbi:DNA polymerase III subunit chi [Shewanella sedimentimangrovi]|uniref:DNA polymerase III subunit chi n=1 Tax=Shewanella sedimentimangrovi TaxID=2814293 RepID=A0ABX7QY30_9GAMM|nr:DNA polymerase III subunit chi [Shewanella sedimentimangrovi]QSX36432.1 DNA polymerase III subunit chi [Shewanella sedimentimangrovi]